MTLFGIKIGKKMPSKDMILLTTSLGYMLSAGITARDGVEIIMKDPSTKVDKEGLQILHDGFDGGLVLSQILKENEEVFGTGLWQQIDTAERTGKVPDALLRISEQLKANKGITSKVKGALAYPMFILVVAVIISGYLFTNTIPEMGEMMQDLGGELPPITVAMMNLSDTVLHHGLFTAIGIVVFFILVQYLLTHPFRKKWHKFISRAPLSGHISVDMSYSRLYLLVNDMVENGSHMVEALRVAASTINNVFISEELQGCADTMEREGYSISDALASATSMPSDDKLMLGIGQRTGREFEILTDLASRRSIAASQSVDRLLELMTPIVMLGVCGIVALLVVSIYMPILTMASSIGG